MCQVEKEGSLSLVLRRPDVIPGPSMVPDDLYRLACEDVGGVDAVVVARHIQTTTKVVAPALLEEQGKYNLESPLVTNCRSRYRPFPPG